MSFVVWGLLIVALPCHAALEAAPPSPPDLTKGQGSIDTELTYNLGPTGLRGWIYTKPADFLDSVQGRTTDASRQILVTHVGMDSPADGRMKVGDVILGVDGQAFQEDARKSFARAIQQAETEAQGGILKLKCWRKGEEMEVELPLRVLGAYRDTAPYHCDKSRRIFNEACQKLEQEPLKDDLWGAINGLALMSTGDPDYMPRVRELAHRMAPKNLKLPFSSGMVIWDWGYKNLFLCEYYLLTDDQEVLPAIRQYTISLARGQSMYGTFGHGIAGRTADGKLHGSIPPYGPVNAAGLIGNLSIVMGKKCGIEDEEIDPAIERASRFFGFFADKGGVPYGEHEPWPYHENNGKNAMAAVMFALQKNRHREAKGFSMLCAAAYRNREYGHTGQGFSYLWGALGANTGGPEAAAAFFRESSWHFDLVRRCDGSFTYDGGEQYGGGKTEDGSYYGKSSYYGLSPNACYVLTYSIPLKKLCITGRDWEPERSLSHEEVNSAIASGRFDLDRHQRSSEELIAAFSDWSPIVRSWAAEELVSRPESKEWMGRLIELAGSPDPHVCQAACEALGLLKNPEAIPVLIRSLYHTDRWVRFKGAQAIKRMRGAAKGAVPEILKAVVETAEPLRPISWEDPIQLAQGQLAEALFSGAMVEAVQASDPKLVYPAIRAISRNADGMARATLRGYFDQRLSVEDVQALSADLQEAVLMPCPADTMFSNEIRMGALKALTKHHFEEGIEAAIALAMTQGGHGSENRTGEIMKEIVGYGSAAQGSVPKLRDLIQSFNDQCARGEYPEGELNDRRVNAVKDAIEAIEQADGHPELRKVK